MVSILARTQLRANFFIRPVVECTTDIIDQQTMQIIIKFHNPTFRNIELVKYQSFFDRDIIGMKLKTDGIPISALSKARTYGVDSLFLYTQQFDPIDQKLFAGKHKLAVKLITKDGKKYCSPIHKFEIEQAEVEIPI